MLAEAAVASRRVQPSNELLSTVVSSGILTEIMDLQSLKADSAIDTNVDGKGGTETREVQPKKALASIEVSVGGKGGKAISDLQR